jgi:hypothetical protein
MSRIERRSGLAEITHFGVAHEIYTPSFDMRFAHLLFALGKAPLKAHFLEPVEHALRDAVRLNVKLEEMA